MLKPRLQRTWQPGFAQRSVAALLMTLLGCGAPAEQDAPELTEPDSTVIPTDPQERPREVIADAGQDLAVHSGDEVNLAGAARYGQGAARFQWRQARGSRITLHDHDLSDAYFSAPEVDDGATLAFQLTVEDGQSTAQDMVLIQVESARPIAMLDVHPSTRVRTGQTVSLDATRSSSPVDSELTFDWQQISGPEVELELLEPGLVQFVAPRPQGSFEKLIFNLRVSDGVRQRQTMVTIEVRRDHGGGGHGGSSGGSGGGGSASAGESDTETDGPPLPPNASPGDSTPPPTLPEVPVVPAVLTGFTLINPETDQPLPGLDPMPSDALLEGVRTPFNIKVNVSAGAVNRVEFELRHEDELIHTQSEHIPAYALFGNEGSDFQPWPDGGPQPGQYELTAAIYAAGGEPAGATLSVRFEVPVEPECSTNADCDDGTYCNGAEHCASGSCVAGSQPCAAQCNEDTRSCAAESWEGLVGIPTPPFGVDESPPQYNANNPLHYYVNNTHPNATNANNVNGSPDKPLLTIPLDLAAGALVMVHGGPYTYDIGGVIPITGRGSSTQPVFVVGVDMPRMVQRVGITRVSGSHHIIIDGLDMRGVAIVGPSHHIAVRNSRIGKDGGTGVQIYSNSASEAATDLVIDGNTIADCGSALYLPDHKWDDPALGDTDAHGLKIDRFAKRVWVVNNTAYHNYGNFFQVGNFGYNNNDISGVYIGGNTVYENRQSAIGIKRCSDVIISQNTLHGHHLVQEGNYGAGVAAQYGPERIWIIYNEIYDSDAGIKVGADSSSGGPIGENLYILGNFIEDCHLSGYYNEDIAWVPAAIMLWSGQNFTIADNTFHDCDGGVHATNVGGSIELANNVIGEIAPDKGLQVFIVHNSLAIHSKLTAGKFDEPFLIHWGGGDYTSIGGFKTATGQGTGTQVLPTLSQPTGNPGSSISQDHPAYGVFEDAYGLDIR